MIHPDTISIITNVEDCYKHFEHLLNKFDEHIITTTSKDNIRQNFDLLLELYHKVNIKYCFMELVWINDFAFELNYQNTYDSNSRDTHRLYNVIIKTLKDVFNLDESFYTNYIDIFCDSKTEKIIFDIKKIIIKYCTLFNNI
jgi:hypothetical protein